MSKVKLGLIHKTVILVGIIEFIAFSILGYLYSEKYFSSIENSLRDRLHQVNIMLSNDELPLSSISRDDFMTNLMGVPYLQGIALGNNGYIIVSNKAKFLGKKYDSLKEFNKEWQFEKEGEKFLTYNNRLTSISYLSSNESTPLYRIILTFDIKELIVTKNRITFYSILVSLLFAVLSSIVIIALAQRFFTKRINESLSVLNEAQTGNLEAKIQVNQYDELGELQIGINKVIEKVRSLLDQYKKSIDETEFARKELDDIIENIPLMIFVKDANDLKFVKFNKVGEDILGIKRDKLIGKSDHDLFPKKQADFFTQKDKNVIEEDKVLDILEEEIDTSSGKKFLNTRKVVIKDHSNNPIYLLGVSEDITKKKETEEQLKEQEKIIEEQSKNAAMGEMIGNIAHQWRQPLSVISTGATGMLMQKEFDTLSDEQFEKTCKLINDNAQYLSKTIDDFKNFIKNERNFVTFKLQDTLDSFLNLVKPSFKRHNIELVLNIDESIELKGYPNELIQCFMNIFNNAKDALKNSSHHNKFVFIEATSDKENVIIKFKDNAGGIADKTLPRIFEPYFTTKHQSQGTGLGLSMTYNLITQGMEGSIEAYNITFDHKGEFYKGAEFKIIIPKR